MTQRQQLIGWLIGLNLLGTLVVWALVLFAPRSAYPPLEVTLIPWVASLPALGNLLAFWAVFGGRPRPWRLVAILVVVTPAIYIVPKHTVYVVWFCMLDVQVLAVSSLLLIGRLLGLKVCDLSQEDSAEDPNSTPARFQFSLWSLLEWTTAFAIVLAVLQYLPLLFLPEVDELYNIYLAIHVGSLLVAPPALWVALGRQRAILRIPVLILFTAAAVVIEKLLMPESYVTVAYVIEFSILQAAWLVGSLWLVRRAGYRLVWRRRAWW